MEAIDRFLSLLLPLSGRVFRGPATPLQFRILGGNCFIFLIFSVLVFCFYFVAPIFFVGFFRVNLEFVRIHELAELDSLPLQLSIKNMEVGKSVVGQLTRFLSFVIFWVFSIVSLCRPLPLAPPEIITPPLAGLFLREKKLSFFWGKRFTPCFCGPRDPPPRGVGTPTPPPWVDRGLKKKPAPAVVASPSPICLVRQIGHWLAPVCRYPLFVSFKRGM